MHILALQLRNNPQPVILKFKRRQDAEREFDAVCKMMHPDEDGERIEAFMLIADDYSQQRAFYTSLIENAVCFDMDQDMAGQVEMIVAQQKCQAVAQRTLQADPAMRFSGFSPGPGLIPS